MLSPGAFNLRALQARFDDADNLVGDLVLQVEDVFQRAIISAVEHVNFPPHLREPGRRHVGADSPVVGQNDACPAYRRRDVVLSESPIDSFDAAPEMGVQG